MNFPKTKPYRSEKYKAFVRTLFCSVPICTYDDNIIPHHTETGGMGIKGSDLSCIPLCVDHHGEIHSIGRGTFEKKYNMELWRTRTKTLEQYVEGLEG